MPVQLKETIENPMIRERNPIPLVSPKIDIAVIAVCPCCNENIYEGDNAVFSEDGWYCNFEHFGRHLGAKWRVAG